MKIFVKVKLRAKEVRVRKVDGLHFEVAVKEPPVEGRANQAIIETLAEYFRVSRSRVKILSGYTARQKVVEVAS